MPQVKLSRTVHVGGKVFFKGDAFVTEAEKVMIDAEIERLDAIDAAAADAEEESEEETEGTTKRRKKADK